MMAKDSVKKRLEREGSGMSFTEFTYQLLQGYDFVELYKNYGCKLQIGGSDQYGNGTTGIELVRKMLGKDDACMLTWPLVTKADGTKFGKSEKGNIWLDPEKTSPYEFYKFCLNQSDEDSERFIKLFTLIPLENIKTIIEQHRENPSKRYLQTVLAEYMTEMIHGRDNLRGVKQATDFLFGKGDISSVDENGWEFVKSEVPTIEITKEQLASGVTAIDLATMHDKVPSKSEARKLIKANGFSINKEKINDEKLVFDTRSLIDDKYLLLQRGKKDYCLVCVN
jgi:tyrosyl-tRNA synthetase